MTIRSSGERVSRRTALAGILIVALAAFGQAALIEDTYSRADSSGLGITEVGGYAYTESNMQNWITNVAAIAGQQLHIHGYSASGPASTSNHGQAGLLAPDLTDTVHLPNVAISTDMSFLLSNTTGSNTTNNSGFIFRKPTATSQVETPGHVEAYILPTGGVMLREKVGGTFYIRYRDNPFVAGDQSGTLNIFQGAGSLPTTINGQPFDADGDGRLEHDEPFHVQAVLVGDRLTFAINGQAVAAARTASDGSAVGTQTLSLCKNRYTSSASTIADPYFDNLSIDVPDYIIRHTDERTP